MLQLAEPLPHGTRSLFIKKEKNDQEKTCQTVANKILKNKMSRQVTTVNQVSFDSLLLCIYTYLYILLMQTSVFFYLAYTLNICHDIS